MKATHTAYILLTVLSYRSGMEVLCKHQWFDLGKGYISRYMCTMSTMYVLIVG